MLRTKSGLPKHCSGTLIHTASAAFASVKTVSLGYLHDTPWSEPFMRAYALALDSTKPKAGNIGQGRT